MRELILKDVSLLLDADTVVDERSVALVDYILAYGSKNYSRGRREALSEASSVVTQCVAADQTLIKLAHAIRAL